MLGIDPKIWGSSGWALIHYISFRLEQIEDAKHFFTSLQWILPCMKCRKNISMHMSSLPFPKRIEDIPKWTYLLHKKVHHAVGSSSIVPSFATVRKLYEFNDNVTDHSVFIQSIIKTHPGKYHMSPEYFRALETFFHIWGNITRTKIKPKNIQSKKELSLWFSKWKGKKRLAKLSVCDTDTCAI